MLYAAAVKCALEVSCAKDLPKSYQLDSVVPAFLQVWKLADLHQDQRLVSAAVDFISRKCGELLVQRVDGVRGRKLETDQ